MLAVFQMALCLVGTFVIFFLSFIFRLLILSEPIWRKACLAHDAWFNHGTKTDSGFSSGSLPELSPVVVYVIHFMHLAGDFLHSATSLAEKNPAFVQSLHKMKAHFLVAKPHISIGFIGDYRFSLGRV
jgi:Trk-type K+ transport system membrane component